LSGHYAEIPRFARQNPAAKKILGFYRPSGLAIVKRV
jgi:hypothetical protein